MAQYGYVQYGNTPINFFLELGIRITTVEKKNRQTENYRKKIK
jgi:hypothetical protein